MLPPVYSQMRSPAFRSPRAIALFITPSAIRSLQDPVGLLPSYLTQTSAEFLVNTLVNRMSGVCPMDARRFILLSLVGEKMLKTPSEEILVY